MDESPAADELAGLRQFLKRLESGDMKLTVNGLDSTENEIDILKLEIARLERVISRFKSAVQDA
jgi:exonuclease VII small subunit